MIQGVKEKRFFNDRTADPYVERPNRESALVTFPGGAGIRVVVIYGLPFGTCESSSQLQLMP